MIPEKLTFTDLLDEVKTIDKDNKSVKLGDAVESSLTEVIQRTYEYSKSGAMDISLKFAPGSKNVVEIVGTVKTKIPTGTLKNEFYQSIKGNLYLDNPEQMKLIGNNVEQINERKTN